MIKVVEKYFIPISVLLVIIAVLILVNRSVQFFNTRSATGYVLIALLFFFCILDAAIIIYKMINHSKTRL
jgi:hypothetical protein